MPRRKPPPPAAFTLVELLVVIAVIAVLAAILFPIFGAARASARRTACVGSLRQIGLALAMYRDDHGELPPQLSSAHPPYVNDARLYLCPGDRKQGQHEGTARLEGNLYLPGGVSYDYVPQWRTAQELGWWDPAPRFGPGKWEDMTPVAGCQWHWATSFHTAWDADKPTARGWQMVLLVGGTVRRHRVEIPPERFTPDLLR